MTAEPERWTLDGFLNHFESLHATMPDHQFCWVIGAGASKSSGIPTGGELAHWWLRDLHARMCSDDTPLEKWATDENLDIEDFEFGRAAEFYPRLYKRRFEGFPEEGYAYLEHVMTGNASTQGEHGLKEAQPPKVIEPGPGYSILAKMLEDTRHSVVITTNFDNLVADALQIYTQTYPFVCGHESLTGFVRVAMRRPVICKIHRDLLLAPHNDPRKLRLLHESWSATLRSLLAQYTPIVIGYGGNDDSLMDRLHSLEREEINGRIIWCYYRGRDGRREPNARIRQLVAELNGVLVPVPDFDRLMVLLGARLGVTPLDQQLERQQQQRARRYRDAILAMETRDLPELKSALRSTYKRAGWWWWQLKVDQEDDPRLKEVAYREAVENNPESAELHGNFADFMTNVRKDHDEAERLYRRALELDPDHADNIGNFAWFMTTVRKDHDEAERLYRRALELDPNDVHHTGNFAWFMQTVRKDHDEAERLCRRALELEPDDANNIGNFADFLTDVRKDHDEAERLYRRALELEPDDAHNIGNFADFMTDVRKDHDEAERLYRRALELDPDDANNIGNFAALHLARGRLSEAVECIDRAKALNAEENQLLAEVLFYQAFVDVLRGDDPATTLSNLQSFIRHGFERGEWTFDNLFEALGDRIPAETLPVLRLHADAILDADKAATLEADLAALPAKPSKGKKQPKSRSKRAPKKKTKRRKD